MSSCPSPEIRVCFCHAVSETVILAAIDAGARTVAEIQAKTQASTGCGGCLPEVERLLEEALARLAGNGAA